MTADDLNFSGLVYASTRPDILALPWPAEQKQELLTMQFRAQHHHYTTHYPNAEYLLIERDGQSVGRLFLDRRADCLHILDIALLPHVRGSGLGTALLEDLIAEAGSQNKSISLYVDKQNTARRLYQRLDFQPAQEEGFYMLMVRRPKANAQAAG